jgi:hypothetical protein
VRCDDPQAVELAASARWVTGERDCAGDLAPYPPVDGPGTQADCEAAHPRVDRHLPGPEPGGPRRGHVALQLAGVGPAGVHALSRPVAFGLGQQRP